MSYSITAQNVSDALSRGIDLLLVSGMKNSSRNGDVYALPSPCVITYMEPRQRVLGSWLRDANPFFHLMEALWMLAGRNDLAFLKEFNSGFGAYSDDGITLHGAYGYRWRRHFELDQIQAIVEELRARPESRRAVLQMWDPYDDLHAIAANGRDVPCNVTAFFDLRGGVLNMTVCNRSNDAIWGAFGANAVHFSYLQEYVAALLGVEMGVYHQITNNLHVYTDKFSAERLEQIARDAEQSDLYGRYGLQPEHAFEEDPDGVMEDLETFFRAPGDVNAKFRNSWFRDTAQNVYRAYTGRRNGAAHLEIRRILHAIRDPDWRRACIEWVERRDALKEASK